MIVGRPNGPQATSARITASEVEHRLADAGQVLLALPHAGCFPAGFRVVGVYVRPDQTFAKGAFQRLQKPAKRNAAGTGVERLSKKS